MTLRGNLNDATTAFATPCANGIAQTTAGHEDHPVTTPFKPCADFQGSGDGRTAEIGIRLIYPKNICEQPFPFCFKP